MTIKFQDMVIEIKAKHEGGRFNNKDTMRMINYLSILADKAADAYEKRGRDALSEDAREFAETTYDLLLENGFYSSK